MLAVKILAWFLLLCMAVPAVVLVAAVVFWGIVEVTQ